MFDAIRFMVILSCYYYYYGFQRNVTSREGYLFISIFLTNHKILIQIFKNLKKVFELKKIHFNKKIKFNVIKIWGIFN
jgi:hypothetical protein